MRIVQNSVIMGLFIGLFACQAKIENKEQFSLPDQEVLDTLTPNVDSTEGVSKEKDRETEQREITRTNQDSISLESYFLSIGLVDIQMVIPSVKVELKYSTTDNFVGIDMYGELEKAFCQPDVAQKLRKAYKALQKEDTTLTLLIFDAVRPISVQQKMWDTLKLPIREKTKFLSNPKNHSIHNYGAAVDISLITKEGEELDMGTPFDYLGVLAHPREEQKLLKQGKLTEAQVKNRKLLRKVMKEGGFFNIQTEWWHWNSCSRNTAKRKYQVVR